MIENGKNTISGKKDLPKTEKVVSDPEFRKPTLPKNRKMGFPKTRNLFSPSTTF